MFKKYWYFEYIQNKKLECGVCTSLINRFPLVYAIKLIISKTGKEDAYMSYTVRISKKDYNYITKIKSTKETCPHGLGWDDCPDCRH